MSDATNERLVIVEPDPEWPRAFERESGRLARALEGFAVVIEHIGSTAVPGLAAKPIIDMMVGVQDESLLDSLAARLSGHGYEHVPEHERVMPFRRFLRVRGTGGVTGHIHAVVRGSEFWCEHLAFRDALRDDAGLRSAYESLKRGLTRLHRDDRAAYTDGKTEFVRSVLATARGQGRLRRGPA